MIRKIEAQYAAQIIPRPKIMPLAWAWRFSALILLISFCKLNMVKGIKGLKVYGLKERAETLN